MSGLRQPPGGTIFNVATDINADVEFLNKLTQLSYVAEQPNHILHDRRWYEQTTHQDTYRSMMALSQNNRRVLYEKHNSGIDSLLIYTPINVNNVISDNLALDIPIYVIFRGTDNIWDVFKDLNLLFNYTTGEYYDASGIQTLVSQIGNYLENQIFNSYSENVVFLSHSLGSKIALNVMDGFKDTIHNNRIKHNVMFNPYIVVDNVYENALSANNDYKSKFEAFIIDGDFASVIYKNHPIGALYTFGNIVPEGSWIQEIQSLTRQQYLNVANHSITAFTNNTASYPSSTYIHYEPDELQDKQVSSVRRFGLTAYDTSLTDEEVYLRKRQNEAEWKVGNINVDSNHISDYDIDIRVASDGKTDMIWKNGYWSYPLEFGLMVNGSLTWDLSNIFYMIRAYNEQSEQSYYMIGIFNNAIKYYRTRFVTDYSTALNNQDKNNLADAFGLETESTLTTAQALGQTSLTHQAYRWFINNPDVPSHAGHDEGLRRSITTLVHSNLLNRYTDYSNSGTSVIDLNQAYEIQCITTSGESGPRKLQATPVNTDDITSSVYPFAVYTTFNNPTYGHTWKFTPDLTGGGDLTYNVDSVEISNYNLGDKFRVASWDTVVGGNYTIQTVEGFVNAVLDFILTDEDDTYYIQDANTKRYLEIFEKPTGWGTSELDWVFWQFSTSITLTDYHKFKIVAV